MIEPSWLGCEQTIDAIRVAELGKGTGNSWVNARPIICVVTTRRSMRRRPNG